MGPPAKYPPEFSARAEELVLGSGRSINEAALSLGIKRGTLGNWVNAARDDRDRDACPVGLNESERTDLQRLKREVLELRADHEILRKAAAHFARETMRRSASASSRTIAASTTSS
jgi:transposase